MEDETKISQKPQRKPLPWALILTVVAVFGLGLGSGWLIWGREAAPTPEVQINPNVKRYDVPVDDDPSLGPEDAPITIIEFSDYQCPYCLRWYDDVFNKLMREYNGQIRFVYRDFPLTSIHPEAFSAAEAANCAGEQGGYWQYHNALFGNKHGLGSSAYEQYASDLGLNVEQFNQCVTEHRYADEIQADFQYAANFGISSTPTFFINGLAVVGAQPYEVFQQIIDKELAGEIP